MLVEVNSKGVLTDQKYILWRMPLLRGFENWGKDRTVGWIYERKLGACSLENVMSSRPPER